MLLELQNLGKSFGEHEVLRDVNAGVERGDRIGIIGANGTGKTTLLRILCGESLPDAGDAAFGTGVTTGYLEQNARLDPSLDIYATMRLVFTPALDAMQEMDALQKQLAADPHNAELTEKIAHCTAVIDAMDAYNMDTQIKKVLNGMGFPADTWTKLAGVLSGGEQTRLRLARLLLERPDLLILDEPTNHLDLETMEWLENYLKAYRGAVLVVSHDRYFLDAVCTRIWELRGKSIKTYRGNYSAYLPQREAADERQQKLHDAAVEKAAKLQDYVDRNLVRASTTKMAQSRRKQLEKLEIVEAPTTEAWELNFRFEYDIEPYDELVIMKNLSVHIGERTLIDALDYVVHRGDKLIIAGPNGAGKSTLLQVLDGKRRPSGGMVRLGSGAKPGTKYYFYVAPYTVDSKAKEGAKGAQLATTTRPTATKCTAAKSAKKQQITVHWNKVKCNGYAVQYSTKKNFSGDKKTLYVSSGKATGNIKTAKGGRTYYVRLRPYTTVGNARYYGSYTAARAVRVK